MIGNRPEFSGFVGSTRSTHLGVLMAGCLAFTGPYFTTVQLFGTTDASVIVRATMLGAVGCWLIMAICSIAAKGGPLVNTVFYPAAIVAIGPPVINALVVADSTTLTHPHVPLFSGAWTRIILISVLPGMIGCYGLLVIRFGLLMDHTERSRWSRQNLSTAFRAEFLDEPARRLRAGMDGPSCRKR